MKKLIIICTQLLCVFVLCGYGLPYTQRYQNKFNDDAIELLTGPNRAGQKTYSVDPDLIFKAGPPVVLGYHQLDVSFVENEEETDKSQTVKKFSDSISHITFPDGLFLANGLDLRAEKSIPPAAHCHTLPSHKRFLLLRVFRI